MRILDVSPRLTAPPTRGSAARITNLLGRLAERHEVQQFSQPRLGVVRAEAVAAQARRGPSWMDHRHLSVLSAAVSELGERTWTTAPLLSGLGLRLSRPRSLERLLDWADVTLVEFPWQFGYCRRGRPDAKLVLASHNIEAAKFAAYADAAEARLTRAPWLRLIGRMEAAAAQRADLVLAVSDDDRASYVERYGVEEAKVVTVSNGADTELLQPASAAQREEAKSRLGLGTRPTALFIASDVTPKRVALGWIRRVAEVTDRYTFVVTGPVSGTPRVEGNVVYTGVVDDLALCYRAADIAICPVAHAGGTKIKVCEAFAAGVPAVAFAESLRAMAIVPGVHALVAEKSEEGLRAALDRVIDEPGLRERLVDAGRALAVERYGWDTIAAGLEQALLALVAGPGAAQAAPAAQPALGVR